MVPTSIFKGKIKICSGKKCVRSLEFKFSTQEYGIDQIVMNNFSHITFSENEKRKLSTKHREIIKQYQALCPKELKKFANDLHQTLKEIQEEELTIEAQDAGTFICLASIFSGKLPKKKDFFFQLESAPIKLFSKMLINDKSAGHSVNVNFCHSKESWLREFRSLQEKPSYLAVRNHNEIEDQLLIG